MPRLHLERHEKNSRTRYTLEFEQEAGRLVEAGQSQASLLETLGIVEQTLFNWVKSNPAVSSKARTPRAARGWPLPPPYSVSTTEGDGIPPPIRLLLTNWRVAPCVL